LILSKTITLDIDFSKVNVIDIGDEPCKVCIFSSDVKVVSRIYHLVWHNFQDEHGSIARNDDGDPLIHTDGTGLISFDLAMKCPASVFKGNFLKGHELQVLPLYPHKLSSICYPLFLCHLV